MAAFTRRQYNGAAAATTITAGINTSDTTCSLTATTGWPSTAGVPFYVVIDPGTSAEEKCSATISGSTLTLTRAQDDTSASSHSAGATIYPVFTANDADEANELVSKLTTKGDLLVTTGSALNRLAVGTNDYSLHADSAATNGVSWKQVPAAGLADRSVGSTKLTGLTLNAQTGTTYTLVLSDAHNLVTLNNASAISLTVPTNASVAFTIGDQVNIVQLGAGQVTVGGTPTINSQGSKLKLNGRYSAATLIKIATDEWVLVGNTAA